MKKIGNRSTFEEVIKANKSSIYRICRIYAVKPVEPSDLFQEVVYHIWKSFDSYQGDAHVSTWVYRISLNVCLRYNLKLDKHNLKTSSLSAISIGSNVAAGLKQGNETQEERFEALQGCIQILKERDRSIIILHLEGFAYKEISEVIGMSENYIAVKMKRIRKLLLDCITPKLN